MTSSIKPRLLLEIIAVGILAFAGVLTKTAANVAFPAMMAAFRVDLGTIQWVTSAYMLTVTLVIPLSAYLQRNFTNRALFLTASVLFTAGTGLIAAAPSLALVLLGRVIQGVGNGIAIPLMFNIILAEVPPTQRGMMMGVGTLITATAGAIGPTYGGLLVDQWGWRMIFLALLPLLVASLLVGMFTIRGSRPNARQHFAVCDYGLLALGLLALLLVQNGLGEATPAVSLAEYGVGLLCLVLFVYRSTHTATPVLNLGIFRNAAFTWLALTYFATFMVFLSMSFVLPNDVQLVLGRGSMVAGLAVLPGAAAAAILSPVSGHLLDRFGARRPILSGAGLMLVGLVTFALLGRRLRLWQLVAAYLVMMVGLGLCASNIMTCSLDHLTKDQQAAGNAVLNTLQQFAGAFGTSLSALIIDRAQRQGLSAPLATAHGMQEIFALFSGIILVELIILTVVLSRRQTPPDGSEFL